MGKRPPHRVPDPSRESHSPTAAPRSSRRAGAPGDRNDARPSGRNAAPPSAPKATTSKAPTAAPPSLPTEERGERLFHWMAYLLNPEFGRELKPSWVRDGGAFAEISALLNERGYRFGRTFLNSPPDLDEIETYRKTLEGPQLLPTSLDFLRRGQILVITSRLPTSDWPYPPKVYMMRGWNELERVVFQVLGPFVPECRRDFVRLETDLVRHLEPAFRDRAAVRFRLKRPAPYYTLLSGVGGPRRYPRGDERTRTAVYLLYLDEVEELNGAGLLALWGMGANESYAWAHLVRTKFSHLLDRPNFTMAELTVPELPKRPTGIEFVKSWPIELILHHEL